MEQTDPQGVDPLPPGSKPSVWKKYAYGALGLLIVSGILMAISMPLFFRVVSILGITLTIVSIAVMLLTFRKSREITPKAMSISIGLSLACLMVYALFLHVNLHTAVWVLVMAAGAGAGIGWSRLTPLFIEGAAIKRAGNIWYLAVWGAIFVLNQGLIIMLGRTPLLSMLLLIFGTGLVAGNSGAYIAGYYKLKADG